MNTWNPTLLTCTRANHDVKLITNGEATKDLSFYITSYAAKNQQHASNTSALLAKSYIWKSKSLGADRSKSVQDLNKRLIQRCANTLTREQELSGPEVINYLMGWGDRFVSHKFQPIHLGSVLRLLKKTWPVLCRGTGQIEYTSEGELRENRPEEVRFCFKITRWRSFIKAT